MLAAAPGGTADRRRRVGDDRWLAEEDEGGEDEDGAAPGERVHPAADRGGDQCGHFERRHGGGGGSQHVPSLVILNEVKDRVESRAPSSPAQVLRCAQDDNVESCSG